MNILLLLIVILEPEVYLCNPMSTPYGVVLTNDYCNNLYLLVDGNLKEIYSSPGCGRYYTISYDQSKIGFKVITEDGMQTPVIYDLQTKNITKLYSPVQTAGQPSFSKDGKIAFTISETLVVLNNKKNKKFDLGTYTNLCPISPDGYFVVYNDNRDQLWLLNLNDNTKRCITDSKKGYWNPGWSPDSRFIAYSTLDDSIKVYDRVLNRTYDIDRGKGFDWSKDSQYLIYYRTETDAHRLINSELFLTKFDGTEKTQLTNTEKIFEMEPSFINAQEIIFHNYNEQEIWTGKILGKRLENIQKVYENSRPLKVDYYKVTSNFGSRDSIDVPYVHQVYDTPDWHNGHWSCAPTTAIMAIAYYRKLPYWDCWCSSPYGHTSHFGNYICSQYNYREVTYDLVAQDAGGNDAWGGYGYMWYNGYSPYSRMYNYLINHGLNSWVDDTPTWEETQAEVQAGWPYCMCVGLTSAGHLVLAVGQVLNWHTLIFNDPYGNKNTPGYPSYDGKYARYDWPGYNNGYQNLNSVYWCRGARGSWPTPVDTLVDDLQIRYPNEPYGFYIFTGSPSTMRFYRDNLAGYNGHFWWTYTTVSTDTCYVTWTPHLNTAGIYEVLVYIPSINADANARYKVYYAGGNQTVTINQNNYSNQWVSLGQFPFNTTGGYVYLGDATGTAMQKIAFDAVRWHYITQGITETNEKYIDYKLSSSIARNIVIIKLGAKCGECSISLYNSTGKMVKNINSSYRKDGAIFIDTSNLPSGVYFIKLNSAKEGNVFKFVKIR
jgi:hypothetical protein